MREMRGREIAGGSGGPGSFLRGWRLRIVESWGTGWEASKVSLRILLRFYGVSRG
jgi:hypothetical protein